MNKEFIYYEYQEENVWNHPLKSGNLEEDFDNIMRDSMFSTVLFLILEEGVPIGFMNLQSFYSIWSHGKVFLLDDFLFRKTFVEKDMAAKPCRTWKNMQKQIISNEFSYGQKTQIPKQFNSIPNIITRSRKFICL